MGFREDCIYTLHLCFSSDITKWCNIYTKTESGFKNHEEFGQLLTSSWTLIGHLYKKYIPSAKTLYTEDWSDITFNYLRENSPTDLCHFWNHMSFFTTQPLCIFLAQTSHIFYKSIPSQCIFSDFPLLTLKFIKLLMWFLEPRRSFSSNFASLYRVMRHNSFIHFHLNLYMPKTEGDHQSVNLQTFECLHEN